MITHFLAAALLIGSCGSSQKTIAVEPPIRKIVLQTAIGGVKSVVSARADAPARSISDWRTLLRESVGSVELRIDGEKSGGIFAWIQTAERVAGYILDRRQDGRVEYSYRLSVRGLDVYRRTEIRDGYLRLTTDVYGVLGPKGELYHVRIVLSATDNAANGKTAITGSATGWSHIGDRCFIVRRIANRQISTAMGRELLGTIEKGGRRLYAAGDLANIADDIIKAVQDRKEPIIDLGILQRLRARQ